MAEDPSVTLLSPGLEIRGDYRILNHLQNGGMGELYLGEEMLSKGKVAIKAIRQDLANRPEIKEAFIEEASRLRDLRHDGIVSYRNAVDDREVGRLFMVMDFIDGLTLKDHLDHHGPLHVENVRLLLQRLCPALGLAHSGRKPVIHRDLSPDNVMLRDGRVSDPVLIDFGISKSIDPTDPTQNVERRFVGKFKYVSPEQCGLFGGVVGPRADIYGLGLMIARAMGHEALPMGSDLKEARLAREHVPVLDHLPPEMQPLLRYMLQPNPEDRPPSMLHVEKMAMNPLSVPAQFGGTGHVADDGATEFDDEELEITHAPGGPREQFTGSQPPSGSLPPFGTSPPRPSGTDPGQAVEGLQISHGFSSGPEVSTQPDSEIGQRDRRGETRSRGGALGWIMAVCLLGAVGLAAFTWQDELIALVSPEQLPDDQGATGETMTITDQEADALADAEPTSPQTYLAQLAARFTPQDTVRAGVLARAVENDCRYATRISSGLDRGKIAVFAQTPTTGFESILNDFEDAFGERPDTVPFAVTQAQCPILDLARATQGRGARDPSVTLQSDEITPAASLLNARVSNIRGRPIWVFLVNPDGEVFDLTGNLVNSTSTENRYRIDFANIAVDAQDPYLFVVVAPNDSLVTPATTPARSPASEVTEALARDLLGQSEPASVSVSHVIFRPA